MIFISLFFLLTLFSSKTTPQNILVFAPHPDDDIIGCGGSLIKHVQAGDRVTITYMTSGEAGFTEKNSTNNFGKIREGEAQQATNSLEIKDLIFLRFPDGKLALSQETLDATVNIIRNKRPDIIYMPHERDKHKDHIATFYIIKKAISQGANQGYRACLLRPHKTKKILCYEVWTPLKEPSYINDISLVMDKKIDALRCHKSQIDSIRYDDDIRKINRYRSAITGIGTYVECFKIINF